MVGRPLPFASARICTGSHVATSWSFAGPPLYGFLRLQRRRGSVRSCHVIQQIEKEDALHGDSPPHHRATYAALVALVALTALAFANSLGGAFVYDDVKQIVGNHLIQEPGLLGEALTSDVWAFKGQREESWSNYWRPTFILWLAGNERLFGVESAVGWHASLILLHALVCCPVFVLLRRLRVSFWPALLATAVFAVHPVHVESVAWISGVPDPLMSFFFLGSLLLAVPKHGRPSALAVVGSLGLFALAMGAKEVAVVLPVVLFLLCWQGTAIGPFRRTARQAAMETLPYWGVMALFLLTRWAVLGQTQIETPWHRSLWEAMLTVPSLVMFYLRQCVFPLWLGPSYPLRAVSLQTLTWAAFWGPLLLLIALGGVWVWACRRRKGVAFGGLLFALPLLPALNINAYIEEQLVHDRYLYLPLLGLLLVAISLWPRPRSPLVDRSPRPLWLWAASLGLLLLLGLQTVSYNRAWSSDLRLWQWGVESDPTSAFNKSQLGYALMEEGRRAEALTAFDQALEITPVTAALLARAEIARDSGRLRDAEEDLRLVLKGQPDNPFAYEGLAMVYQRSGKLDLAEDILKQGKLRVPQNRCAFSSNLGVVRYLGGRKGQALQALRSVPPLVASDHSPACRMGLFHLGNLYRELGNETEAREAHRMFLDLTGIATDPRVLQAREQLLASGAGS